MSSKTPSTDLLITFCKNTALVFLEWSQIYSFMSFLPSYWLLLRENPKSPNKVIGKNYLYDLPALPVKQWEKNMPLGLSLSCSPEKEWDHWTPFYMLVSKSAWEERPCPVSYQSSDSFTGFFLVSLTSWIIEVLLTHVNLDIPLYRLAISVPRRERDTRIQSGGLSMKPAKIAEQLRL